MKKHLKGLFPSLDLLRLDHELNLTMAWRKVRGRKTDIELVGSMPPIILANALSFGSPCCGRDTKLMLDADRAEPVKTRWTGNEIWTPRSELLGTVGFGDDLITLYRRDGEGRIEMADGRQLKLGQLKARTTVWQRGHLVAQIGPAWKDSDIEAGIVARTSVTAEVTPDEAIRICALLILTKYDSTSEGT
jgi:hypothetical protein